MGAWVVPATRCPLSEALVSRHTPGVGSVSRPGPTPYTVRAVRAGMTVPRGTRYWFDYGTEGLDSTYEPAHAAVRAWLARVRERPGYIPITQR